ncbi:GMC oxidoreductase [Scytonema sp. NUACC21]
MFRRSYGRRRFLQSSAVFSGSLMASVFNNRITRANDEPGKDEFVKAIIIGSGFGGAVAALRLGQAGINTVLLERGRRWPITPAQNTFATFQNPDGRSAWLSPTTYDGVPVDIFTGVLERKDENGISVLCGAGVGGSSLVYNAITYQPVREVFYRAWPNSPINYDELDQVYYPRVRSMLKASPLPEDILATDYYASARLVLQQAATAGIPSRLVDIAVDWDIVRQEIAGTKVASAINGEHWYGINSGAKNSLDRNYLTQAEQTGLVEILPLHIATAITEVPDQGYRVSYNQINEIGETIASKTLTCRYLFLAAGSMGTSALLVKAKATGTLPRLNDQIGKSWGTNGDTFADRSGLPVLNSQKGGPATTVVEHLDNPLGPVILTFGPAPGTLPDGILRSLAMGIPSDTGNFEYDAATSSVKLFWPADTPGNKRVQESVHFTCKILDRKNTTFSSMPQTEVGAGMLLVKNKSSSQVDGGLTAHPLGGAVLGKACDSYGRIIGYQGLYVVDSALIPGSTGCVNPSLTIAAIAERCMERIIAEDFS